jgi:hypothetical protein
MRCLCAVVLRYLDSAKERDHDSLHSVEGRGHDLDERVPMWTTGEVSLLWYNLDFS